MNLMRAALGVSKALESWPLNSSKKPSAPTPTPSSRQSMPSLFAG